MTDIQARRITRALTTLVLDHPFFGAVALGMRHVLQEQPPAGRAPGSAWTACTNGKQVAYNPEFVSSLSGDELVFLVAHEAMHPMLEHNFRMKGRDPKRWNIAADMVINKLLIDEGIGQFIDGGVHDPAMYAAGSGVTEAIYNLLPAALGDIGGAGQDLIEASGPEAEIEQQVAEMRVAVSQAAQAARMQGKLSAGMARFADQVLNPKVAWRDVLQQFVVKTRDDTRTFARPNRRFLSQGLYLPSVTGQAMGELVIAVDCSGSIDNAALAQFAAEIKIIHEDQRPAKLHIVYFDSEVSHYDEVERDGTLDIKAHGGGGTAFSPIFRFVDTMNIEPVACVVLTDLCCSDFGSAPDYPVLWVSSEEGQAPWGEVVVASW